MALALYRKYRPATFSEVVGQEHVTEPLRTALAAGRINHAYLFSGPRGCGKTSSARILARSLNCVQGPTPDPCGVCGSCIALAPEGPGSLDVVELDAASHGGVDDTRDLRDKAFYMPAESRYRVFIIDEAHMVTTQGFNALLKIVEEPPEHLVFIFATTEPDKVLTTIRSRTHHYPFRLIPPATLRSLLERLCAEEGAIVEPAVLPLVIRAGGGSARDSLSVLDQLLAGAGPAGVTYRSAVALLGVTDAALIDEVVDALAAGDGASVFGAVDRVVEAGHDPRRFAADLLQRLRDLMIINAIPDAAAKGLIDSPEDQLASMIAEADRLGIATLTRMAEVMHTGLVDMRGTTSPRLLLELLCARMLLPGASSTDAALLQRLERMERRMDIAGEVGAHDPGAAGPPQAGRSASPAQVGAVAPAPADRKSAPAGRQQARPPVSTDPQPGATTEQTAPPAGSDDGQTKAAQTYVRRGQAPASTTANEPSRPAAGRPAPDLGLPVPPTLSSSRRPPDPSPTPDRSSVPTPRSDEQSGESGTSGRPASTGESSPGDPPAGQEGSPERATGTDAGRQGTGRQPAGGQSAGGPGTGDSSTTADQAPGHSGSGTASPTAASTIGVTDVRRVWPEILAKVQRQRRTTQILLESATVVAVDAGVLRLSMPHAGTARRVLEPSNADPLREALKDVLGVDWTIKCEAAAAPGAVAVGRGSNGVAANGASSDPAVEPPPPDDDDIPDDYGEPVDPAAAGTVRDPEEVALELLSSELGARRLDPPA